MMMMMMVMMMIMMMKMKMKMITGCCSLEKMSDFASGNE